jgi:hypothetical protein
VGFEFRQNGVITLQVRRSHISFPDLSKTRSNTNHLTTSYQTKLKTVKATMGSISQTSPAKSALGVEGYALITGGGSGIGRATSLLLAREYSLGIALADVNETGLLKVKKELEDVATNPDFKCITVVVNVADEKSVQDMVAKVVQEFGRIDYAANIAGIGAVKGPIAEGRLEDWNKMMAVNLTGVWLCAKEEILQMTKQKARESAR